VIYPGNTLFEEDVRGFNLVQKAGFQMYLQTRLKHPL
jgi:hypothetical protein